MNCLRSVSKARRLGYGRCSIVRVYEVDVGPRHQLLLRKTERVRPGGVEMLEVPVVTSYAQHVDREFEEALVRIPDGDQRGSSLGGRPPICNCLTEADLRLSNRVDARPIANAWRSGGAN